MLLVAAQADLDSRYDTIAYENIDRTLGPLVPVKSFTFSPGADNLELFSRERVLTI